MHLDGFFSDVFKFKAFEGKKIIGAIAKNPTRLITGVDPASTRVWNVALGTKEKALVDQWGGTTKDTAAAAKRAGINIAPGMAVEAVAHMVASWYAAGGLAKAVPNGGTLFKIAEKLKTAADQQGGVGPGYLSSSLPLDVRPLTASSLAPGEPIPSGPFYSQQPTAAGSQLPPWLIPAGAALAAVVLVSVLTPSRSSFRS